MTTLKIYMVQLKTIIHRLMYDKEMFDFSTYQTKSKYCDNSNKLVVDKMKEETDGVATEEFAGLKPQMYSYLVNDNSEHKKVKGVNKNVVATISHNE